VKTYALMGMYSQENQLAEFLTYYLRILQFDQVIFVERFFDEKMQPSLSKSICRLFGERVIYDAIISPGDGVKAQVEFQHILVKKWLAYLRTIHPPSEHDSVWVLYVDCDEFVRFPGSIATLIEKIKPAPDTGIGFVQSLFGHNDLEKMGWDELVIETHPMSVTLDLDDPWYSCKVSTLLKENWPRNDWAHKTMYPLSSQVKHWLHNSGQITHLLCPTTIAGINHYMILSKELINRTHPGGTVQKKMREMIAEDLRETGRQNNSMSLAHFSGSIREDQRYQASLPLLTGVFGPRNATIVQV